MGYVSFREGNTSLKLFEGILTLKMRRLQGINFRPDQPRLKVVP